MQRQEAIWYKRGRDVKPTYCKGHQKRSGTQAGPNQDSYVGNDVNMKRALQGSAERLSWRTARYVRHNRRAMAQHVERTAASMQRTCRAHPPIGFINHNIYFLLYFFPYEGGSNKANICTCPHVHT